MNTAIIVAIVALVSTIVGATIGAAAAKAAKLTIAHADQSGHLISVAQVPTQAGARNAVVTKDGTVYLAHAGVKLSALVVVSPSGK